MGGGGFKGWSECFTLLGEDPPWAQQSRAGCAVIAWSSMPVHNGRGCGVIGVTFGVIRLTSWVALWTKNWCSMPVHYATGCAVIGVTSWVALWTEN